MLVGLAPTAAMISPANPGMRIFKPFKSSMVLISFLNQPRHQHLVFYLNALWYDGN
jgi:hypothetical protein